MTLFRIGEEEAPTDGLQEILTGRRADDLQWRPGSKRLSNRRTAGLS